jgi:hypothetical protein
VDKRRSDLRSTVSGAEYQHFAEQFVDLLVDPKQGWFVYYIMTGGLDDIPTEEEIDSGKFALGVLNRIDRGETQLIEVSLYEALTTGDRGALVPHTKQWAMDEALSREEMGMLLKIGRSRSLQHSFKQLKSTFRFRVGGKTKLATGQYDRILKRAEQLRPAIEKILSELTSETSHTLPEILKYCHKDYPEACDFLSRHLQLFQQAFNDKRVMNRATKRLPARARTLADAMAGTDYNLAFSTSIERVREARRIARRERLHSDSPQISG